MEHRNLKATLLHLGGASALLMLSILVPLEWWPTATSDSVEAEASDPYLAVRRNPADVVAERMPTVVDAWDQLKVLAPQPVRSGYEEQLAANIDPPSRARSNAALPAECAPTLPSWAGARSVTVDQRMASRRDIRPKYLDTAPPQIGPDLHRSQPQLEAGLVEQKWPAPTSLIQQLERFTNNTGNGSGVNGLPSDAARLRAAAWAASVLASVEQLAGLPQTSQAAAQALQTLRRHEWEGRNLAGHLRGELKKQVIVANYALTRRLGIWELAQKLGDPAIHVATVVAPNAERAVELEQAINAVRQWLKDQQAPAGWNEFLLLDELSEAAEQDPVDRNFLARRLEWRVGHLSDPGQAAFAASPVIEKLRSSVRQWVSQVAWDGTMLATLEQAELGDAAAMRRVACMSQSLAWSPDTRQQELGRRINAHYRNANIRLSVTEEFLNGWLEDPEPEVQPFRESILGARVQGKSYVNTKLALEFQPSNDCWHFIMQAGGLIRSSTTTLKGPATVFSSGHARYVAEKDIWLRGNGPDAGPARAATVISTRMKGFRTDYDGIPLLGGITRAVVRHQHDEQMPKANKIAERKSSQRISVEMDRLVERQLEEAAKKLEERISRPLERMHVEAAAVAMQSTDQEAVVRCRLAGDAQLGAFTPRPAPPAGSALDMQVHQSAVNNLCLGLDLGGKRSTIAEVATGIAKKLGADDWQPTELPRRTQRTIVTFAESQPLSVEAEDDLLTIRLKMVELDAGRNDFWYDFDVIAVYEPEVDGAQLRFVRNKPLRIEGEAFGIRDVLALRAIFAAVFDRERPLTIISEKLANEPAMREHAISQCVLANGWIGVALSATAASPNPQPSAIAQRTATQQNIVQQATMQPTATRTDVRRTPIRQPLLPANPSFR